METGTFEPVETGLIGAFARTGKVFVDVGANFGYFVCLARRKGAHVVAIEPLRENLAVLYDNIAANGWGDIEIFPVGLSSKSGLAVLYGGGTGASFMEKWAGTSEVWKRTVAVSTLDIVLGDRFGGQEMLIKIDVEGVELQVIQGAARALVRTPAPVWLVEVTLTEHHPAGMNPVFREVFQVFWSTGYTAYAIGEAERVVTPADVERWVATRQRDFGHYNYVFRKVST